MTFTAICIYLYSHDIEFKSFLFLLALPASVEISSNAQLFPEDIIECPNSLFAVQLKCTAWFYLISVMSAFSKRKEKSPWIMANVLHCEIVICVIYRNLFWFTNTFQTQFMLVKMNK